MPETNRRIEIFSAECPACDERIREIRNAACPSCDVQVLDMRDGAVAERARKLGIRSIPAVVIGGILADCCAGRGPDLETLQAAGLGRPV